MTRDYKNISESKIRSKKSKKTKPSKGLSAWFLLFSGVVIGSFVSFLIYLAVGMNVDDEGTANIKDEPMVKPQNAIAEKAEKQAEEKKRFEFYSILPQRQMEMPVEEVTLEKESVKITQPPVVTHEPIERQKPVVSRLYILQVGSFSRFKDADKRKANLAFMGVASKIHAISKSNSTMYRVQVGPFGNIKKVNEVTSLLKQKKIPSLLMKVKG